MALHLQHMDLKVLLKLSDKSFLGDCHLSILRSSLKSLAGGKGSLIFTALLSRELVLGLSLRAEVKRG